MLFYAYTNKYNFFVGIQEEFWVPTGLIQAYGRHSNVVTAGIHNTDIAHIDLIMNTL